MWFVAALFVAYLPFYFLIGAYERKKALDPGIRVRFLIYSALMFACYKLYHQLMPGVFFPWNMNSLPWHIEYIPYSLAFLFFGYAYREWMEAKLEPFLNAKTAALLSVVYLLLIYIPHFGGFTLPWYLEIFRVFAAEVLGVLLLVLAAKAIPASKYMTFVGQNTLIYFGLHGKFMSLIEAVLRRVLPTVYQTVCGSRILSIPYSLAFAAVLSVVLIPFAMFINRFLPFMIGKSFEKKKG